jgi:hypothetical protein
MLSYYEALPIYRAAMDIAVRVDAVVQGFPRRHKYTLGARLREGTLDEACGNVKRRRLDRSHLEVIAPLFHDDRLRGQLSEPCRSVQPGVGLAYLFERPAADEKEGRR